MSFTIEEALLFTSDLYQLKIIAGKSGVHRQISWVHLLEDTTIIHQFWGNELAVTTCLGFQEEAKLLDLVTLLQEHKCAGIIINTGKYITRIPKSIIDFCETHQFPLITVPWEIYLADLIKDFCIRTFSSQKEDQKMIRTLTKLFKSRSITESARNEFSSLFDSRKGALLFYISFPFHKDMDYMEQHKILFQLQSLLDKEAFFSLLFPFESAYILLLNGFESVLQQDTKYQIATSIDKFFHNQKFYIGCSNPFFDTNHILSEFDYAKAASYMAIQQQCNFLDFATSGVERLWFSYPDKDLLKELYLKYLTPIIDYDKEHNANYLDTLYSFLKHNGSIQCVAKELFTHRNTIQYRMTKIKDLLNCDLENANERCHYLLAFYIKDYLDIYKKIEIL